jgi:hypothetical protein
LKCCQKRTVLSSSCCPFAFGINYSLDICVICALSNSPRHTRAIKLFMIINGMRGEFLRTEIYESRASCERVCVCREMLQCDLRFAAASRRESEKKVKHVKACDKRRSSWTENAGDFLVKNKIFCLTRSRISSTTTCRNRFHHFTHAT